jgi:glycosyltransferase involved in cell wall biosynthesis
MEVAINAQLISFGQTFRNAGVSRYTYSLLEGLGNLGSETHDQRYTVFINPSEAAAAAESLGQRPNMRLVPNRRAITNPLQRIAWEQFTLPHILRRSAIEVFHSPVNVLPSRLPCASVLTVLDVAFMRYPDYFRPSRRYYQRIMTHSSTQHATRVAAISEATKRDLIQYMHVPADHIAVIPPAVPADFRPVIDPGVLTAFRARNHLPERYLLYLGTLEPRKNLERLIDAYGQALSADPELPPLVVAGGKGWYYESIFARVRRLGLERAITFVGYVSREEQPLWYAGAAAFIYPSLYEGFGLPVLEALACGTPTITSNVSSLPEAAGPVAAQVSPTDTEALAGAIGRLLHDAAARQRMASAGPAWAARFTLERMALAYRAVYAEAAERWHTGREQDRR